ncbi:unnamed protein product [Closterium sp. NIES-54]
MGDRAGHTCRKPHTQHRCFSRLDDAWRAEFGDKAERPCWAELLRSGVAIFDLDYDAILFAIYALSVSAKGNCYLCVPPDPGMEVAALGATESALPGTAPAEALHTFTLHSGASRYFFRDSTTLTPLSAPVPVRLADPSGGLVLVRSSTVLPCPAVPSGSLSGLHLPSFSTKLVSTAALKDAMVTTTTPGGQRLSICMCTRTGRHLATFTRRSGSSLYTLATEPSHVAASAEVSASGPVAPPCSCLLWHHRHGHPSLPCLRGMHSRLLVSGLPKSLPPLPPSPAPPCLPCVEGRQRAAPHSSSFPPTTAPLQTLHMDVWGPARVSGQGRKRYFLLLNLWPRISLPETSPTLHWTEKVGDALVFWVWGSRAFVRDASADKLSARAVPCVFLGFSPYAPGWQFYHPTSRRVLPSHDVTFDESVPFYSLFSYCSAPPPPPPLFLAPVLLEVLRLGVLRLEVRSLGLEGVEPGGAEYEGAESGGAEPREAASSGGPAGASTWLSPWPEPHSQLQLRKWFAQRTRLWSGAAGAGDSAAGYTGAGGVGATRLGGAGVPAGAGGIGGAAVAGPGGACTRGTGAAGSGSVGGAGAGDPAEFGGAGVRGAGARDTGAGGAGAGGAGAGDTSAVGAGAGGIDAGGAGAGGAGAGAGDTGAVVPRAGGAVYGGTGARGTPASPLPAPSPYTEQTGGLTERREPVSCPASPVRAVCSGRRVPRPRPPTVPSTHAMALRPSSVPLRVPLPPPPGSSLPTVPDFESDLTRATRPTVSRLLATVVTGPFFESTVASALVAELVDFADACRLDYATALVAESESDYPRPSGAAMDAEMASWKSTDTYVEEVPPPGANIVDGMWIFRVQRPPGSPLAFKARYVARGFGHRQGVDCFQTFSPTPKMATLRVLLHVAAQRDYKLHSLDFSTAFLQGSLHEEIWLRRPPGFTRSFPAGTQWSLRRPVYGLRQAPREWHDTVRSTLAAMGFTPSTADPSLFLRTDTSLPPFYVLVYVDDLVFATADIEALTLVKSEL